MFSKPGPGQNTDVRVAFQVGDVLGECPLWDAERNGLWWLDLKRQRIHFGSMVGTWSIVGTGSTNDTASIVGTGSTDGEAKVVSWDAPGLLGCAALTDTSRLFVAGSEMWTFDPNAEPGTGFTPLAPRPDSADVGNRFNDGRVDQRGQLLIGTMDNDEVRRSGSTYRINGSGAVTMLWGDVGIPNAMCFSPDGTRVYWGDSWDSHLYTADVEPATGEIGPRRIFAEVPRPGFTDGACTDSDGGVWVCLWDGHRIVRFTPDGSIDREIALPVARPTCPAFGGPDLSTLFVTSAAHGLTDEDLNAQPLAGAVLSIDMRAYAITGHLENRMTLS